MVFKDVEVFVGGERRRPLPEMGESFGSYCARTSFDQSWAPDVGLSWRWDGSKFGAARRRSAPSVRQVYETSLEARSSCGWPQHVTVTHANGDEVFFEPWLYGGDAGRWSFVSSKVRLVGYELPSGERVVLGDRFRNLLRYEDGTLLREGVYRVEGASEHAPDVTLRSPEGVDFPIPVKSLVDPRCGWERVVAGANVAVEGVRPDGGPQGGDISVLSSNGEVGEVARRIAQGLSREFARRIVGRAEDRAPGYPDRSAVDALLREDARKHPEFARARRAGVLAAVEHARSAGDADLTAARVLHELHAYERSRGGGRSPSVYTQGTPETVQALDAYERARGLT